MTQLSAELRQFLAPTDGDDEAPKALHSHGIWGPGIRLMRNLQFVLKAALICSMFLVPMAWLTWSYFANIATQVDFSAKERLGIRYNRALLPLMAAAQELRRVGAAGEAAGAAGDALKAAQDKLAAIEREIGPALNTARAFTAASSAGAQAGSSAQSHSQYLAALASLLGQVNDASNLTLDPDIDSYYLMDAVLLRIPAVTENSAQLSSLGQAVMKAGAASPEQQRRLVALLTLAQYQFTNLQDGLGKAQATNPELPQRLKAQEADAASSEFLKLARKALVEGQDY